MESVDFPSLQISGSFGLIFPGWKNGIFDDTDFEPYFSLLKNAKK
jgi:hypothetical protein